MKLEDRNFQRNKSSSESSEVGVGKTERSPVRVALETKLGRMDPEL